MNWAAIAKTAFTLAGVIVPQIGNIESIAQHVKELKGPSKEDAVIGIVKGATSAIEGVNVGALLTDPNVEAAARSFIQGYVALQNAVAAAHSTPAAAK